MKQKGIATAAIVAIVVVAAVAIGVGVYVATSGTKSTSSSEPKADVTDDSGQVTFNVAGQNVSFQFIDETTGSPVSDLSVGFALDPETQSQGVLLIIDPSERFSPQTVILQGETTPAAGNVVSFQDIEELPNLVKIALPKGPTTTMGKFTLKHLPKKVGQVTGLIDATVFAAKALDQAGLPVGEYIGKLSIAETKFLTREEAMAEIRNDVKNKIKNKLFFFVQPEVLAKGELKFPNVASVITDVLNIGIDATAVMACGPTKGASRITVTTIGSFKFYGCGTISIEEQTAGLVRANVDGIDERGLPLSKGSLRLVSKTHIGLGFKKELDNKGEANVEVPTGNYQVHATSEGFSPTTEDVLVSEQEERVLNLNLLALQTEPVGPPEVPPEVPPETPPEVSPETPPEISGWEGTWSGPWQFSVTVTAETPEGPVTMTVSDGGTFTMTLSLSGNSYSGTFSLTGGVLGSFSWTGSGPIPEAEWLTGSWDQTFSEGGITLNLAQRRVGDTIDITLHLSGILPEGKVSGGGSFTMTRVT